MLLIYGDLINPFHRDTILVVADIFGNNFINSGNIETYFTESCPQGPNDQFLLNFFIQFWAGFEFIEVIPWLDEQIQEKFT